MRRPLDESTFKEIHRALLDWKAIFFRDQDLSLEQHAAFARRFGELEVHPFLPEGEVPEVVRFAKDDKLPGLENGWHSDVSWREVPSHIPGLDPGESLELLDLLIRQAHVPESQCRFHWENDSIAFWDNRSVQHDAASDYFSQQRVMERVAIIGERPR